MFLAIALSTGLTLVLFLTGLLVVFTPLPVALAFIRKGMGAALVVSAVSLVALVALYRLPGEPLTFLPMMVFHPSVSLRGVLALSVAYLSYYLWLGWIAAYSSRRTGRWSSLEPSVAWMTVLGLAVPVAGLFVFAVTAKMDLWQNVGTGLQDLFRRMIDLQQSAGLGEEDAAFLRASAPLVVTRFLQVLPSLWIDLTLAVLSLTVLFLRRWTREERLFPNWPDFGLWRLKEIWIWAPIGAGAVYFLNVYAVESPVLGIIALNALIVLAAVSIFQGLSVASFFFRTRLSPLMRLAGYLIFFIFLQVGLVVLAAVGVSDFWFDFRKLKKVA
ncbi:MAG TPA: DUF2232 domain-containing protein [bacterium]|nr:DUF2232 domain-containing protein [bacterium]